MKSLIIACLFSLFASVCFSQQKHKLRFDGFYYWDNQKDTTIKAGDAFTRDFIDATTDNGMWENGGVAPPKPGKVTVYMPGSRRWDIFCFYEDGTYFTCFLSEEFTYEYVKEIIDTNRVVDVKMGIKNKYTLRGNQVYFEHDWSKVNLSLEHEGIPWTKALKVMFTGTIMEDSIRFVITSTFPPGRTPFYPGSDTIRVCRFVPFK